MWTFWGVTDVKGPLRRVGVNFGAPGDRRDDDGVYWVEHPSVGGKSPSVSVSVDKGDPFRLHSSRIAGPLPWVAASGLRGLKSVTLTLDKDAKAEGEVDVRLVFAEPDEIEAGARVLDVSIKGQPVLKDFDIAAEAGGPRRSLVKEFKGVKAGKELKVSFASARKSPPVLCGIEVRGAWPEPAVVAKAPVEKVERVDDEPLLLPVSLERDSDEWSIDPHPFYWVAGICSVLLVVLLLIRARTLKGMP